jgi:hypothetical protein
MFSVTYLAGVNFECLVNFSSVRLNFLDVINFGKLSKLEPQMASGGLSPAVSVTVAGYSSSQ